MYTQHPYDFPLLFIHIISQFKLITNSVD